MRLLDGAVVRSFGEAALVIEYGDQIDVEVHRRVLAADAALTHAGLAGVEEVVPTYRSVLVRLDPLVTSPDDVGEALGRLDAPPVPEDGRRVEVVASFAPEDAPDLGHVAEHAGVDVAGVVALLTGVDLRVHLHGFAPGFAYLGGVPAPLHVPRRATPRPPVPPGSVLLAAGQAALCPTSMPTGWWVVGRTEQALFDAAADPPVPVLPGDRVRLVAA